MNCSRTAEDMFMLSKHTALNKIINQKMWFAKKNKKT